MEANMYISGLCLSHTQVSAILVSLTEAASVAGVCVLLGSVDVGWVLTRHQVCLLVPDLHFFVIWNE